MNKVYEFYKDGLHKTIILKDHVYDMVEFTITQKLYDETGKLLIDSKHDQFFTKQEFKEFFSPMVNDLKERFDDVSPSNENR